MKYTTKTKRLVSWAIGGLASCFVALSTMGQGLPFTQSTAITVNDNSKATPYPSTNQVQNTLGTIEKVTVTLNAVTHGYPDDLDIALVGPDGTKAMLMSDAGGQFDLSNTTITFDSTVGTALPDEAQINSGTYKPSNFDGGDLDTFFGGPPTGPLPADLAVFNGKDANGTWNLYVVDDTEVDSGTIRSWSVNLFMSPTLQVSNSTVNITEDTPLTVNVFVNDSDTPLSNLTLTATSLNTDVVANTAGSLVFGGDVNTTNRTLRISPVANASGPATIRVSVADGVGAPVTRDISINVVAVNDPPSMVLSASSATIPQGGISDKISIRLTDVDSDAQGVTLTATSSSPTIVPATNVLFFRATDGGTPGTNRTVQIAAGSATGSSTITIIATDAGGASSSTTINVTVSAVPSIVVANPATISIPDNAASALYPSTVTVPNPSGLGKVGKVVVSLINVEHANPSDIGVLLVSPSGQSVVLMRGDGDSTPVGLGDTNDVRLTFDKDASSNISASPLVTSTNKPTDLGAGNFPGAAPAGPYSADLSTLQNLQANGDWKLYVYDTTANGSAGQIAGGWVLQLFSAPTIAKPADVTMAEDTTRTITTAVGDFDGSVTNIVATSSDPNLGVSASVSGSGTGGTATVVLTPAANFNSASPITVTLTVQDNTGSYTASTSFAVTVTPVNDTPTQSVIPKQISRAGDSVGPVSFTVGDVETPNALTVTATSDNPKLLPPGAVILGGSGTSRTVTIFPAGTVGGVANITVTVTDPEGASSSQTFNLTVLDPANRLFENTARIVLNDATAGGSIASPYPSTIPVSGLVGKIAEVQVTLFGITHPNPDDLDIMLVGPMGTNVIIMSDAGGRSGTDLTNVTLVFHQDATDSLPDNSQIISGDYKPTDFEPGVDFPFSGSPAPSRGSSTFNDYIGANPNGDWKLYIYDDTLGTKGGAIEGGWQLSIRTRPQMPDIGDITTPEDTVKRFSVTIGDVQPGVTNEVTASIAVPSGQQVIDNAGIKTSITDGVLSIELTPIADAFGTNVITLTIKDPDNFTTSDSFNFIVTPVDDPPRFGPLTDKSTPAATPISFQFNVSDPEGTAVTVTATSSDPRIVKDSNISISGSSSPYTISILPEGIQSGSTTITITAADSTGQKTPKSFVLTVTPTLSFQNAGGRIVINDFDRANPYPSTIDVSGVNGTVSGVSVILVGLTHPFPDDVDVLLVSPDNKAVMLMSDAGGGSANGVSNVRLTFTASASTAIPDETQITSGSYLPANYLGTQEGPTGQPEMPSPAPSAPGSGYSVNLGDFAGVNPNGQWKLFVRDDTFTVAGSIEGGWILNLQTAPTISSVDTQVTQEDTPKQVNFSVADQDTASSGLNVTVTKNEAAAPGLISSFSLATNGFNYILTINPATNRPAGTTPETNTVNLQVTDGTSTASTSFLFVVNPVDDAPTITTATNRVIIAEDGSTVINFLVKDIDSTIGTSSNIMVFSSNPALVAAANLSTNGPNNQAAGTSFNVAVTVTPIANQSGSTVITFVVSDRSQSVTNQVTVEVTPVNDLPTITFPTMSSSSPTTNVVAGGTISNIPVTVGDVETPARNLDLVASSSDQLLIPNGNIIVGGSGADRTITLTAAGTGSSPGVTISVVATDGDGGKTTNSFVVVISPSPAQTFGNNSAIQIPASGTVGNAAPYPSTINVGGFVGNISKISVTLDGLTHTAPDDLDILLVSPTGAKSLLLSDVGGANPISNVRLTFDQSGRGLGDDAPIISGTYQPTDFEVGSDVFPSPAPAGPYTTSLQNFIGTAPNGVWSLYIVDDTSVNAGQLAFGWSIRIETAPTITLVSSSLTTMTEDSTGTVSFDVNDQTTTPDLLLNSLEFSNSNPNLVAGISKSLSGNRVTAVVTPIANASGTNNLTITVRNSSGTASSITVPMNVAPVNDLPEVSRFINLSTPADTATTVPILVRDIDTPLSGVWVEVKSSDQTIVANTNIFVGPGTNFLKGLVANFDSVTWTNLITLKPFSKPGPTTISVDVYDTSFSTNTPAIPTSTFVLTVTPVNHQPQISSIISPQPIEAGKSSTNIDFTVSDADNDALTVTASSDNPALVRDSDIVITPSGTAAPGARTVKITTQPGVKGDVVITVKVEDPGHLKNSTQFVVRVTPTRERILASTAPITIRDNNTADPYPSILHVDGFSGTISKLTVTLNGFSHTYPDDVDVLLVSPDGTKSVILMSDAGGGIPANGLVLKFDDTADTTIPDATALSSGTFKPFNYEGTGTDNFASRTPAGPAGPYGATLSGFNGISPNGDWKLYIVDDTAGDSGAITNGWSLGITTLPVLSGPASVTSTEDRPATVNFTIAEEAFGNPDAFTFSVSSTNTALVPSSTNNIVVTGSGTNRTVTVIPTANASGTTLITITEQTSGVTYQFVATFTPVNDLPVVTPVADQTLVVGSFIVVTNFNYSDVETAKKDITITFDSSDPLVVPNGNIFLVGNDIRIFSGTAVGTSRITITATDANGGSTPTTFNVTVTPGQNPVFANTSGITIPVLGSATPYPSTIDVRGVSGTITKVTVTLQGLTHPYPDDIDILLVGPNGKGVVLMSDAGAGGNPQSSLNNAWITFDDGASQGLPDNSGIDPFGTYKPTNFEVSNNEFAAPAPAGPYAATFSAAFGGSAPNGTWSLFVQDDAQPDGGRINGWTLGITTTAPTISGIPDQIIPEDTTRTVNFTIADGDTGSGNLTVTADVLVDDRGRLLTASVSGTGTNRTLTLTPTPNATGTTQVTVSVTDGTSTNSTAFNVIITPVNDAPVITGLSNTNTPANIRLRLPFTVSDVETPSSDLTINVSNSDNTVGTAGLDTTSGSPVIVFSPIKQGNTTVSVAVSDGTTATTNSFVVTVTPPAGPGISEIPSFDIDENTSLTVSFTITNSPSTNVTVSASFTNPNLISKITLSGSGTDRQALITLVPNRFGFSEVDITVSDDLGSATAAFGLTVHAVTPPATLGPISDRTTDEDVPARVVLDVQGATPTFQGLTFTGSASNPGLVSGVTFAQEGTNMVATVNLVPHASGLTTVTINMNDGSTTTSRTFALNVIQIDDAPVIAPIGDRSVNEDSQVTIQLNVTDSDSPLSAISFSGVSSNLNVVSSVTLHNDGTSVFAVLNLVSNANGIAPITITATEGTNTVSQSFVVTVVPVNDLPMFGPINDRTNIVNTTVTIPLTIKDVDTDISQLTFTGATTNSDLISAIRFNNDGTNVTATITLVPDAVGTAPITITAHDGTNTVSQSFTLTVVRSVHAAHLAARRVGTDLNITVSGDPGASYVIEATTDFISWITLGEVTIDSDGSTDIQVPIFKPYQFFRARNE